MSFKYFFVLIGLFMTIILGSVTWFTNSENDNLVKKVISIVFIICVNLLYSILILSSGKFLYLR